MKEGNSMKSRSVLITAGIVVAGIVAGLSIVFWPSHSMTGSGHAEGEASRADNGKERGRDEKAKGPHGGRLLESGDFGLEVTIFEKGVPPEFRAYAYEKGKAVGPAGVNLRIALERLGAAPEDIAFRPEGDYLRGAQVVAEPHSFKVAVTAEHKGQAHRWSYEQAEGRVPMADAVAKAAGIEVRVAGSAKIRATLQLQGEIQVNQDRVAHVVPRLAGVVTKSAKNLGDPVKKGDLLAVLESQTLADLRSEHLAAEGRLELARDNFEREKRLWEEKVSARQDYLASRQALAEAQIAHRNAEQKLFALGLSHEQVMRGGTGALTRFEIRAPIDGVVTEKHLGLGEAVKEDANIFTIADLSTVWAEMTIYPRDLGSVKLGQMVSVRASALNAEAAGKVSYVGSLIGEQTRSAKARVTLQNPQRSWRPGLFVTVDLVQHETQVPVAVSVEAVQDYRDGKVVFGRFGEVFEARPVELGRSDGKLVEIVGGFAPGSSYAATGSFVLKADLGKAGASHDH
ncbi:MAG: efflux RND transporter periplasmic adaptor subunit [Betaproteobacteria bacterium]|nr:efflux RND transporter periplasmic adaptor subunit [Betaproteobacteria bacterium]